MLKKLAVLFVVLGSVILPARAFWKQDITMLVMPREALPVQIAQDISRRYPVLPVCYQISRGNLKIHAWNGEKWIFVPVEDYTNGVFFANRPKHAIIVESDKLRAPRELTPCSTWCESASRITSTDPRVLLHLLGTYFDFPFSYWDLFAARYNYALEEINPALINVHWWNMSRSELLEKRAKRNLTIDFDKWRYLATLPPPPVAPVTIEEMPKSIPETKTPESAPSGVIKVSAPEPVAEKAPAVKPAPETKPVPAVKPAPEPKPVPAENKPASETKPVQEIKPAAKPVPEPKPLPPANPAPETKPVPAENKPSSETKPVQEIKPTAKPVPEPKPLPPATPVPAPISEPAPVPALKPVPEEKPFPSLKPDPVIKPAPEAEPAPAPISEPAVTNPAPALIPEPAPIIEPPAVQPNALLPEPAPLIETTNTTMEADPFSAEDIPAAEIIVPQTPKKPWWKKLI